MTRLLRRAVGPVLLAAVLSGCGSTPPAAPDQSIRHYVALGDGFTAAPDTDTAHQADPCQRSANNYPAQVAKALHVGSLVDVSCIGATTKALTSETRVVKGKPKVPPQFDALTASTDLVTLGIGIEDGDLLHNMFNLCAALPCGTKVPVQVVLAGITTYGATLTDTVRTIQAKAPKATIVLVGYPRIAPAEGGCRDLPTLSQPELDAANYLLDQVNRQMQSTARQTGSSYLDMAAASSGHDVCSGDSWISGQGEHPGSPTAFHPRAAEQRAVTDAVVALVKSR